MTTKSNTPPVELVYDGESFRLPAAMGTPREDQCLGTPAEKTVETAGRVCYDSYSKGRPSSEYHEHIFEVKHLSVDEHVNFTCAIHVPPISVMKVFLSFLNRPGIWVTDQSGKVKSTFRITFNIRSLIEWPFVSAQQAHYQTVDGSYTVDSELRWALWDAVKHLVPSLVEQATRPLSAFGSVWANSMRPKPQYERGPSGGLISPIRAEVTTPVFPQEKWITLYMRGGRGWSHEQVRHKYGTAVSQRSTRYVDETETPWAVHPLIREYREQTGEGVCQLMVPQGSVPYNNVPELIANELYAPMVDKLQNFLLERGADKQTARKQARGAARGYLGNALQTEMLFSANVQQWRWMLHERGSQWADAEIRELFAGRFVQTQVDPSTSLPMLTPCVWAALQQSKYRDSFEDIELHQSPDGLCNMTAMPDPKLHH